jgi:2-dehydropantoate 2-reductase
VLYDRSMKIAVFGAGAMGSIFGARLAQAGHETVLVDVVEPLVQKLNEDGVTVVRGEEETRTRIAATTDPASVGVADVVIFFTKCYHTAQAAEAARPLVGRGTVVASLQNGWGNGDVLASVFPPAQIVVGVTYNSGLVLGPARVMHPSEQPTTVGSFADGDTAAAERLAGALGDAAFETAVASPVRPEIWKKLVLNAATLPTSALCGMTAGMLGASEHMRELVAETAQEASAVARALGYNVDARERVETILALLEKAGPTKGSMVQDFEAGRRTEIDVITGAVVKAADEIGVPVPVNRTLLRLVKGWEAARGLS